MHHPILLTVAAVASFVLGAKAQSGRYRDLVFPSAVVQSDIQYGAAFNPTTQVLEPLLLDLYEPANDAASARPAVVIVHGGGFIGGDKTALSMQQLGADLARRGYVAISINYRLGVAPVTPLMLLNASHDMKAAVRWLRTQQSTLRLEPGRIGCIGSSAGAITSLQTAYVNNGEGTSGNPGVSSAVHAVVDLWGGLVPLNALESGEAPVQIIHGTTDPTVPYQAGVDLHSQALAVGVPTELHPITGFGHGPWGAYFQSYHVEAVGFFYEHLRLGELAGLVARPGFTSPGVLQIDTFGVAGDAFVIGMAPDQLATPIPGIGTLCIGPPENILVAATGTFGASTRLAAATTSLSLPPGLGGSTFHWQAIHLHATDSRWLTNCTVTAF